MHGIVAGTSTSLLARELGCQRPNLVALRRRLQPIAGLVVRTIPRLDGRDLGVLGDRDGPRAGAWPSDCLPKLDGSCR